jgi:hypothetical protein
VLLTRGGGEGSNGAGMSGRVRGFEVCEVTDRAEHRIQLGAGQGSVVGSQVQGRLPDVDVEESFGERPGLVDEQPGQGRIELAAAARPHHGHRTGHALLAQEHLCRIREMHDPHFQRDVRPRNALRQPLAVPPLKGVGEQSCHAAVEPHIAGQHPGGDAVRGNHGPDRGAARRREARPVGNAGEWREACAGMAEHAGVHGQAVLVAVVVVGAEGDIVREQRGQFEGIRVAADPGHLVGVVEPALAGGINSRCPGDP